MTEYPEEGENELHGLFCMTCGNSYVDDQHRRLHKMREGEKIRHTETDKVAVIKEVVHDPNESEYPVQTEGYVFQATDESENGFVPQEDLDQFEIEEVNPDE